MTNKIKLYFFEIINSSFVKNVALTFSNRVILLLIGLTTSIAIARCLGPDGRGIYAIATLFIGLGVQFGNLGLHASNTYVVSKSSGSLPYLIGNSILIGFIVGTFLMITILIIKNLNPTLISLTQSTLITTLITIPFSLSYLLLQNILLGINKIREFNRIELISKILLTILIISFLLLNLRSVHALMIAMLISSVYSFISIIRYLKSISDFQLSFKLFKSEIGYGTKSYFSALFAFLQQKLTLYFVSQFSGVTEAGFFSISVTLFDLILLFPITIGSLFFPRITAIESELDKWKLTRKVLVYVFVCMSIVLISLFPITSLLINVLYGAKFTNSVTPLIFLLPGTLFMSLSMIIMNYLGSCGNPIIVVVTPLVSLLFIFVSAYFLKDGFNSITAAKVNSVSCAISLFIVLIYFFRKKLIIESSSLK